MTDPTAYSTYCSAVDVASALGMTLGDTPDATLLDRVTLAALLGTAYVDMQVSGTLLDTDLTPPYSIAAVACPPAYRAAAVVAAVRYYSSKDVPFGVVSVGEYGKVVGTIPEADLILRGHSTQRGIA